MELASKTTSFPIKLLFKFIISLLLIFISLNYFGLKIIALNQTPQKSGAIVVISGGNTSKRVEKGIELFKNNYAPIIIFSGAAADPNSPSNAKAMKLQAIAAGLPESAIILDESSRDTNENGINVVKIAKERKIESILLVTSNYHSRRANILFKNAAKDQQFSNLKIISVSDISDGSDKPGWYFNPANISRVMTEIIGIIEAYARYAI
jgi:uncharacterized SAM-binding protein YcdF (DUF218 family)